MESTMLDYALAYARAGLKIFPCCPGLKIPLSGTHGVHDASSDEALVRAWWGREPNANIAVACGAGSGVWVIDVDVDEERGVNGYESLTGDLPATWIVETPRGGRHYYFTATQNPPRSKNSFRPGIDIRGDGYYVLAPPSIHPNGGVYEWANGYGPNDVELAEFPEEYKPAAPKPVPAPWRAPVSRVSAGQELIDRAVAYLETMEPAVQGQGGHNALLRAASAMTVGFDLDDATALSLLWTHYNPRCSPPWDQTSASDRKDFERKVAEARKTSKERPGYIRDVELEAFTADPIADERGDALASIILAEREAPAVAPSVEAAPASPAISENPDFPQEILHPRGLVGELADWINATAGCPQPGLAVAASLAACGALFSRKVRDESDGRTNLFVFSVAHSSAGKDWGAKAILKLFHEAGGEQMIAGTVTSDTAIEKSLEDYPVKLFVIDEVGHFMSNVNKASADNAAYLKTIKPTLMKLYSSAKDWYVGKTRADGEVRRLQQPSVCVYGMTSPDILYGSLTREELRDGWLARVVCFISNARPRYRMTRIAPIPPSLVEQFRAWISRVVPPDTDGGDIAGATGVNLITVPTTPEGRKVFEDFGEECYKNMLAASRHNEDVEFLWGKGLENARRIALTVACGETFDGAAIDKYEAEYGVAVARQNIRSLEAAIARNMAETDWQRQKNRVLEIIRVGKENGVAKSALTRKSMWIRDKRARDSILDELIEAGLVVTGQHEGYAAQCRWFWASEFPAVGLVMENKDKTENNG